jgi:NodT family efflux transporter outer membrane factor (OMF) lipoprotein
MKEGSGRRASKGTGRTRVCSRSTAGAFLTALLALAGLAGCAVGPDYRPPESETPDLWHQELTRGLAAGKADLRTWWTELNDPVLDGLIGRATQGNLDLKEALGRIMEARAVLGVAKGEFFPDADGTGSEQRTRDSENVLGTIPPPGSRTDTFYSLGVDASWEIDVWGRIRRSVESARSNLQASVEDYRDVLVSLYAEVAATYVDVRSLQARLRYALGNVETQRGSVKLTEDRRDAGIGSDLDVSQARLNLSSTESFVPALRSALAQAIHRLGVLLGEPPNALYGELTAEAPTPAAPDEILIDVPANLIRQRPDIRRAERQLAAQTARIGVATAELYPRFSLSGVFAFESFLSSEFLDSDSRAYQFGPFFRWNLFDGGRVRNAIRAEEAVTEQALARYEQSVLRALEEAEDAMVAYAQESERRDALGRSVAAAQKSVELVNTLYRTGLTDFQNVLDMERSLFEQQDALAESEGLVTRNLIRIYKALGGGWAADTTPPATTN